MIESKDLALIIQEQIPGSLVTNAEAIKAFVEERIKEYTPELYYDDPDAAKRDRAVLNSASKTLNQRRLDLEREHMRPFEAFKALIKSTTMVIDTAAAKLDEIVKAVEETQRNEKRREIEADFATLAFDLVPLDRLFDPKWLNKGAKMQDVEDELRAKVQKVYADIATIEGIGIDPSDAVSIKANYLDSLDIGAALALAQRLKANRERLAQEAKDREARKHAEHLEVQAAELRVDTVAEVRADKVASVAAEALELPKDPIIRYVLEFRGTRTQLINLRAYMTREGIEYDKIEGGE